MSNSTKVGNRKKLSVSDLTLYIGAIVIFIIFSVLCSMNGKDFLTMRNIENIIKQSSVIAVTAIGASLVIMTGGIDLSVGSIIGFIGIFAGLLLKSGVPIYLTVAISLVFGMLIGLLNGVIISHGKVPAFITTLGIMQIFRGLALLMNSGRPVAGFPIEITQLMNYKIIGIPISIFYVFVFYAIVIFVMGQTKFGRHVYAIGGNPNAAKLAGVNVKNIETMVYVLAGLFSAIGALMLLSRLAYADPNAGSGYEMTAIASCVIGGISLSGGRGKVLNTLVGALILGMLTCGLQILNVLNYWQTIITGVVIIFAVFADKSKERKAE